VKMRADRMGLRGEFCISSFDSVIELLAFCKKNSVEVLFQDSLQTLTYSDLSGHSLAKKLGAILARYAKEEDMTTVIIGQITKGGEFAGPMQIKHIVDVHCHLSFNRESGNRIIEVEKNRFGPAMSPYEFSLSAHGIDFKQLERDDASDKKFVSKNRKDLILLKAKELLLDGERLSGYSHDENAELSRFINDECGGCSGGFWRGMLTRTVAELEREGNKIGVEKLNRRDHFFLEERTCTTV